MKINWVDLLLIMPGAITIGVLVVLTYFTEGDANHGYKVFGSDLLGAALFTYLVSLMVLGLPILIMFVWGLWRIISRLF